MKAKKIWSWSLIVFFSVILIIAAVLFSYQQVYAGKIYKNIYFGDIDLSGKTKQQAMTLLEDKFKVFLDRTITLKANGKSVDVKLEDTGLSFDAKKIVDQCYGFGREKKFLISLKNSARTIYSKYPMSAAPFINQTKYDDFLEIAIGQLNNPAKDATVGIKDGAVVTEESQNGQIVDTTDLINLIINLADSTDNTIELPTTSTVPGIKTEDFANGKSQAEAYLGKAYTFVFADKKYSPTKTDIGNWIEFKNANGLTVASINIANVKVYLNKISKDFEVKTVDKKINASTGDIIDPGKEGLYLDKDKTLADFGNQAASSSNPVINLITYTEQPTEKKVFPTEGFVPGRFEGRYIDVDLTTQQLCRVEGQNLVDCFIISSGKPSTPTITGTFSVIEKNPRKWSNAYSMWLPWWEEFDTRGYGLHELPEWPNGVKEGEAHLGIPVSHGCVRMGVGTAELVYNWTEIGTPIYIHK